MSAAPDSSGGEVSDGLHFEVISPEEVRRRARAPQSSGLSSSLGALGVSRSASLPSGGSTPTSHRLDIRNVDELQSQRQAPSQGSFAGGLAGEEEVSLGDQLAAQRMRQCDSLAGEQDPEDAFVPPHLLSFSAQPALPDELVRPGSLYEGVGRKLRGMDAVRFRRSVMQQTGFLEPSTGSVAS